MWSHEVSAQCGQFTQQALMQGAYARQINPFDSRQMAENLTGNFVNRAVGGAAPIAKFAGGLMGMDSPMSGALTWGGIGATVGMAGGPAGALLGAGVGAGLGAGIGTLGSVAQFGVGNFMTGMQQQQGLNAMLRQQYGFMRPGGYGFTGADMGMIGGQIRSMSHQAGPGGEMHSFAELSQLASNMGRMGFSQNVTDVRQFTQKFRQMVDTLKTVSKELGTSLQSAQEMVVGMRQSGIFNTADQIKMAQGIRANNLAGVSMEASSQMANVGSQIARSIGGLGRAGAFAGMRTIQQVSAATRVGALTEEDIYNATGLTGEQGQMALAQNQMSASARFLKSGRGRYLVASMAGSGGRLDEEALAEFAGGGYGVGRTSQLAHRNLGRVGRADFIRNEGRLRSEILNRLGGNVNTLALMGWAGERGIDIGAMGDREMLFAQRMLGMGRDEMDVAVKQANAMGDIGAYMKRQQQQDDYQRDIATARKNVGLEGMKNTFNRFREHTQSKIQKYGSQVYQDMSNMVERQLNRIFGTYESQLDKELDDAYSKFVTSGGRDLGAYSTVMASRQMAGMAKQYGLQTRSTTAMPSYEQYRKIAQGGGITDFLGTVGGALGRAGAGAGMGVLGTFGPGADWVNRAGAWGEEVGRGLYRKMGGRTLEDMSGYRFQYDPSSKVTADQQLAQFQERAAGFHVGAGQIGLRTTEEERWAASARKHLMTVASADALRGTQGLDRGERMLQILARQGDKRAEGMLKTLRSGNAQQAAAIGRQVNTLLGATGYEGIGGPGPFSPEAAYNETAQDRLERMGMLPGTEHARNIEGAMAGGQVRGTTVETMMGGPILGIGRGLHGYATGRMNLRQAGKEALLGVAGAPLGFAAMAGSAFGYGGLENWMAEGRKPGAMGEFLGKQLGGMWAGADRDVAAAIGKQFQGAETQKQFLEVMQGGTSSDAWLKAFREFQGIKPAEGQTELTSDQKARSEVLRTMMASSDWKRVQDAEKNKKPISAQEKQKLAEQYKFTNWEQLDQNVRAGLTASSEEAQKQQVELARKYGGMAQKELRGMGTTGIYDVERGKLSAGASRELERLGLKEVSSALGMRVSATAKRAGLANVTDAGMAIEGLNAADQLTMQEGREWEGMSTSRMRETIKALEGAKGEEGSQLRATVLPELRRRERGARSATRTAGRRGAGLAAAGWMGVSLDRDTQRQMMGAQRRGDTTEMYGLLMQQGGFAGLLSEEEERRSKEALDVLAGKTNQYTYEDPVSGERKSKRIGKGQEAAWAKEQLSSIAAKHEKERQDKGAHERDPSFRMLEKMSATLDKIAGMDKDGKMQGMKINGTVRVEVIKGTVPAEG